MMSLTDWLNFMIKHWSNDDIRAKEVLVPRSGHFYDHCVYRVVYVLPKIKSLRCFSRSRSHLDSRLLTLNLSSESGIERVPCIVTKSDALVNCEIRVYSIQIVIRRRINPGIPKTTKDSEQADEHTISYHKLCWLRNFATARWSS